MTVPAGPALRALFLACAFTGTGFAHSAPLRLKAEATVAGDVVRLGDLVENAGESAHIALFSAPALGAAGTIRAERIAEAARELGLAGFDAADLKAVVVRRASVTAAMEGIHTRIRKQLAERDASALDAPVALDRPLTEAELTKATTGPMEIEEMDLRSGRFLLRFGTGPASLRLRGTADLRFDLPVLARPLARGDVIAATDLTMEKRSRRELPAGTVSEPAQLIGTVARRALSPGQPLKQGDIATPDLVDRNQLVTVTYEVPGMSLTLRGRALASGVLGSVVAVQNGTSKKTIEAVVTGPGRVTARLDEKTLKAKN